MPSLWNALSTLSVSLFVLFLSLSGCPSPSKTICKSTSDCGAQDVCLQTGVCAKKCTTTSDCGVDQKCSQAQGCVAASECGSDRDCSGGQVCSGFLQQCKPPCQQSGCSPTTTCLDNGHCSADTFIEGPGPGGGASQDGGCGGELFEATFTPANVLVLLDRSGSMNLPIGSGARKWDVAKEAVRSVTSAYDEQIRFGLVVFPEVDTVCSAATSLVTVGDRKASTIQSLLPADPGPNTRSVSAKTPLGAALTAAANIPEIRDPNYANFVLLVTDGKETCSGNPLSATQQLASLDVKTYVVGFGSEVDPQTLSRMAQAGGTTRAGSLAYYQAEDASSLQAAMTELVRAAAGCDYKLKSTPPDLNKMYVYVNGAPVARDTSRQNGWDYSSNYQRITLFGQACSSLTSTPGGRVSLVYGCPDDGIVERPGSGTPGGNTGGGSGGGTGTGGTGSNSGNGNGNGDGGVTIN